MTRPVAPLGSLLPIPREGPVRTPGDPAQDPICVEQTVARPARPVLHVQHEMSTEATPFAADSARGSHERMSPPGGLVAPRRPIMKGEPHGSESGNPGSPGRSDRIPLCDSF